MMLLLVTTVGWLDRRYPLLRSSRSAPTSTPTTPPLVPFTPSLLPSQASPPPFLSQLPALTSTSLPSSPQLTIPSPSPSHPPPATSLPLLSPSPLSSPLSPPLAVLTRRSGVMCNANVTLATQRRRSSQPDGILQAHSRYNNCTASCAQRYLMYTPAPLLLRTGPHHSRIRV